MDGGKWVALGWRHPLWDLVRFYLSLRGNKGEDWSTLLRQTNEMKLGEGDSFPIDPQVIEYFFSYLLDRDSAYNAAHGLLRTEADALAHCESTGIAVGRTTTRNQEHHQSSKAIIATVSAVAEKICDERGITFNTSPQTRCAWCVQNQLHVTARNIDGAIPSLANPTVIWEIKEYWGSTGGGSKMSDAVYECNLVGRELREYEEATGTKIHHFVFLDGKVQWERRKSDLKRFIDLTCQGFIDKLFIGKDVENLFGAELARTLDATYPRKIKKKK